MRAYGGPTGGGGRLEYQPALDGLRAVAVALVVVFHLDVSVAGVDLARAGYLGVSVFFTLSGFLITSLLVAEHDATDRISLGDFYRRRLRRLMPASWVTLLVVALLAGAGVFAATARLRGDLIASALQALNVREMVSDASYAELFAARSPVAHFWSLGVEEQFYWIWPPLVALALARGRLRRLVVIGFVVTAIATPLTVVAWSADAAYYAPWTRIAEILAGAVLAIVAARRGVPAGASRLALPALAAVVVVSFVGPSGVDPWMVAALPMVAIASTALIAGLQHPGRVTSALSVRPLVALGRVSYGVYLVHWPVIVALDPVRVPLGPAALALLQVTVTLAASAAMFVVIERPIRIAPLSLRPGALAATFAAGTAMVVATIVISVERPTPATAAPTVIAAPTAGDGGPRAAEPASVPAGSTESRSTTTISTDRDEPASGPEGETSVADDPADPPDGLVASIDDPTNPTAPSPLPTGPAVPGVVSAADIASAAGEPAAAGRAATADVVDGDTEVVGMFGDSVAAWLLRDGADDLDLGDLVVLNATLAGCDGMVDPPPVRDRRGDELPRPDDCREWPDWYPAVIDAGGGRIDVAVLVLGQAVVLDREIDGDWTHPCDGIDWYLDDVRRRIGALSDAGAHVVLTLPAHFGDRAFFIVPDDADDRIDCVRRGLTGLADELGVAAIDLDDLFCPDDDCTSIRRDDGIHIDRGSAGRVLTALIDRARQR